MNISHRFIDSATQALLKPLTFDISHRSNRAVQRADKAGIGPEKEGIKRAEMIDSLDIDIEYRPRTVLNHLMDIGVLAQTVPPGPDVFAISERLDGIVNQRVTEEVEANLAALIAHIDDELQVTALSEDVAERDEPQA